MDLTAVPVGASVQSVETGVTYSVEGSTFDGQIMLSRMVPETQGHLFRVAGSHRTPECYRWMVGEVASGLSIQLGSPLASCALVATLLGVPPVWVDTCYAVYQKFGAVRHNFQGLTWEHFDACRSVEERVAWSVLQSASRRNLSPTEMSELLEATNGRNVDSTATEGSCSRAVSPRIGDSRGMPG